MHVKMIDYRQLLKEADALPADSTADQMLDTIENWVKEEFDVTISQARKALHQSAPDLDIDVVDGEYTTWDFANGDYHRVRQSLGK
jgi:hypothetical protein